jgi:hypothetical protein
MPLTDDLKKFNFSNLRNHKHENLSCLQLHDLIWDNMPSVNMFQFESFCYALYEASRMTEDDRVREEYQNLKQAAIELLS